MAGWDGEILLWIQEYVRTPGLTFLFRWITLAGNHGLIWITLAALFLIIKSTRKAGAAMFMAMLFSFLINNMFLKLYVGRIRPYEVIEGLTLLVEKQRDYSFPSGHTACAVAASGAFWMMMPKERRKGVLLFCGIGMMVLAALMGFSRLYVGVHYPTDVIAGACSGWGMAALGTWAVRILPYRISASKEL
ncbi:phosphatase PAP2 family protein [Lachnospiraceae bacterium 62-35]